MKRVENIETVQGNQVTTRFVQATQRFGVEWSQKRDQLGDYLLGCLLALHFSKPTNQTSQLSPMTLRELGVDVAFLLNQTALNEGVLEELLDD